MPHLFYDPISNSIKDSAECFGKNFMRENLTTSQKETIHQLSEATEKLMHNIEYFDYYVVEKMRLVYLSAGSAQIMDEDGKRHECSPLHIAHQFKKNNLEVPGISLK